MADALGVGLGRYAFTDVFVHPVTGCDTQDHMERSLWLGTSPPPRHSLGACLPDHPAACPPLAFSIGLRFRPCLW